MRKNRKECEVRKKMAVMDNGILRKKGQRRSKEILINKDKRRGKREGERDRERDRQTEERERHRQRYCM